MKYLFSLIILGLAVHSCKSPAAQDHVMVSASSRPVNPMLHSYDTCSVIEFLQSFRNNHLNDYHTLDSVTYDQFCLNHGLAKHDEFNLQQYYGTMLVHDLLTSQGAVNGSSGTILNIPYFWHWVNPNPRHDIFSLRHGKPLKDLKPPAGYGKYATYADIDRTPGIFIAEMFSPEPLYHHADCDTFNTFGWCSEREMAFVCLMELLGNEGKIIVSGNHSWSEIKTKFKKADGTESLIIAIVDNTFNSIEWVPLSKATMKTDTGTILWYNQKASSEEEKAKVKNVHVVPSVSAAFEKKIHASISAKG